MRRIQFRVDDLPPKKGGEKSMWSKPAEAKKLIALRKEALKALKSQEHFIGDVRLTLRVHVGFRNRGLGKKGSGDLDNFVAGVCDGLMPAQQEPAIDQELWSQNPAVDPEIPVAFEDDSQVVKINAEKLVVPEDHSWYEIELEGE